MTKVRSTKDRILNVAGSIFGRFGFQKTTVDEIAKAAHKAKGSVYYYFQSKEDLFQKVVEREAKIFTHELVKAINSGNTAKEKLANYTRTRMHFVRNMANYYEAMKDDYLANLNFIETIRKKYDDEERIRIKMILVAGITSDEFDINNVDLTAQILITILKGFEIPYFTNNKDYESDNSIECLLTILMRGLEKC